MKLRNIFKKYFWTELKWDIICFFTPRQKWLTDKIPNNWCDKVELIPLVLFEILVNFVEQEMEAVSWDFSQEVRHGNCSQEYSDHIKFIKSEILSVYDYIKIKRPSLEQELKDLHPPLEDVVKDLQNLFDNRSSSLMDAHREIERVKKEIEDLDTQAMYKIVKYRSYLWT